MPMVSAVPEKLPRHNILSDYSTMVGSIVAEHLGRSKVISIIWLIYLPLDIQQPS